MARRFQFRLETLLRVRELREREAKRKVGAKHAEIAQIDRLNRQTDEEISRRQDRLREYQQQAVLAPEELVRERAWIAYLRRTIAERRAIRAGLLDELATLQAELREARKQKLIIEKLRERRWEEYTRDRRRREQAESDELARQLLGHQSASPPADAAHANE